MDVRIVNSLIIFFILFLILSPHHLTAVIPKRSPTTLQLFHSKTGPLISWDETVLQSDSKDQARLKYLVSLVARKSVPIASGRQQVVQSPTYVVRASVGTPPQTFLMALDTNNDAAWVPCGGCQGCPSTVFSSELSTSYKLLGCQDLHCQQVPTPFCGGGSCSFNVTYGGSIVSANLSQDTVNLAGDDIPDYTFGCIQKVTGTSVVPAQGLLGLGRGPLSLLSQSQSLYQSTFSYCLPSYKSLNFSGSLWLGQVGQPKKIKYTPLLKNPRRSSLYYVNLVAIKVGKRIVDNIPPSALAFNSTTGAGTIIDSGTVFTRLVQPVYEAVRDEFRRRMGPLANVTTLGGFDTCYSVPISIPSIVLLFDGLNVSLPQDNFLIRSSSGSISCLAMAASPNNVNSVLNVIASFQQQNHRYVFDVPNNRLGITRQACS